MRNWLKNIVALIILAALIHFLHKHWEEFYLLFDLHAGQLVLLYSLSFAQTVVTVAVVHILLQTVNAKTSFVDMFILHNAAVLLNHVPMKLGTIVRANYLKRQYGLSYSLFAAFFFFLTLLMVSAAAIVGLIVLLIMFFKGQIDPPHITAFKVLLSIFGIVLIAAGVMALIPLPTLKIHRRLELFFEKLQMGRKMVLAKKPAIVCCVLLLCLNFVIASLRLAVIYQSISQDVHPIGCLMLGSLGFVILFLSVTPGGLGIRELALGAGAMVLGLPLKVGILAAMIERVVLFTYFLFVGGGCAIRLLKKYPDNFKTKQSKIDLDSNS